MSRLTARDKHGHAYFPQCFEDPCCGSGCQKDACEFLTQVCEKLAEYEELEESGRLIKTPCAVGDTVYEIIHDDIPETVDYICKYTVDDISAKAINFDGDWNSLDSSPNVYFTREEAEEALRKLKGETVCQKKRPAEPV